MNDLNVKRTHGLGNVLLLLPVLERFRDEGRRVRLHTRPEWTEAVGALAPGIEVRPESSGHAMDLDAMTLTIRPTRHRTHELARLLGRDDAVPARTYAVPDAWAEPFARWSGATVFAPEAGHPARAWPQAHALRLAETLSGGPLVITGTENAPPLPCDADLRGALSLTGMLGLLSVAGHMITMDSGALHMATSVGLPTVALFGGVDPTHRIRSSQRAVALQTRRACAPCGKRESCAGAYPCLRRDIRPEHALAALEELESAEGLVVTRIEEAP